MFCLFVHVNSEHLTLTTEKSCNAYFCGIIIYIAIVILYGSNAPQNEKSSEILRFRASLCGAPDRNRIHNLLIRSQTLYPVELRAHVAERITICAAGCILFQMYFLVNRFRKIP